MNPGKHYIKASAQIWAIPNTTEQGWRVGDARECGSIPPYKKALPTKGACGQSLLTTLLPPYCRQWWLWVVTDPWPTPGWRLPPRPTADSAGSVCRSSHFLSPHSPSHWRHVSFMQLNENSSCFLFYYASAKAVAQLCSCHLWHLSIVYDPRPCAVWTCKSSRLHSCQAGTWLCTHLPWAPISQEIVPGKIHDYHVLVKEGRVFPLKFRLIAQ